MYGNNSSLFSLFPTRRECGRFLRGEMTDEGPLEAELVTGNNIHLWATIFVRTNDFIFDCARRVGEGQR